MAKRAPSPKECELPTLLELKAFLAVARCESVTRAAEQLSYFNPSSVLYHIRTLERTYNVELFVHNRKRMQLTEQGKILYSAAEEILRKMQEATATMVEGPRCVTRITLGGPLLSLSLMRAVYGRICNQNPGLEIRFTSYWESGNVEASLLRGEIDAGILYGLPGRDASHLELASFRENIAVVAAVNPILGDGIMVTRDQLSEQRLIVPRTNSDQNAVFTEIMSQLRIRFRSIEEAPNLPVAIRLVRMGCGVSLQPASTARENFSDAASQVLRIVDADPRVQLNVAYPSDKADLPGLKFLLETIRAVAETGVATREE